MATLRSGVRCVNVAVNDAVQGHGKATCTDRCEENPQEVNPWVEAELIEGEYVPHQHERQREERVLHFHELKDATHVDVRPLR
jgi:hypothetical protein